MLVGRQTWTFPNEPKIIATGTVGGPFEAKGKLKNDFDYLFDDTWMGEQSFEKAQKTLMERSVDIALHQANVTKNDVNFLLSGDLINQITPSNFAAEKIGIPFLGLFSACATSTEGLGLAALMVNTNYANYVVTGTASHNSAAERQYRYPTEYGGQKPPTAQWTVTGAGSAVVAKQGNGPSITSATIGKVVDYKITDPFNMGAAMAPAAVDTIIAHLNDRKIEPTYYDYIVTGDLGKIGQNISYQLLKDSGVNIAKDNYIDCGTMIYADDQPVNAGGSGTACSAVVTYGHLLNRLKNGEFKRMLVVATGSLHSPMSVQQKESIPCIAHAVSIERTNNANETTKGEFS